MLRLLSALLVAGLLTSACATQTPYRPAEKRGAEGYTETKLTDKRYRITFTGNSVTPAETVKDFALLRAAELTLQEGYDWFALADRSTDTKVRTSGGIDTGFVVPPTTQVYRRCGLMSCDTVVASSPGYVTGVGASTTTTSTRYAHSLEIVMGKHPMPDNMETYDARQLASTLRRLMNQGQQ